MVTRRDQKHPVCAPVPNRYRGQAGGDVLSQPPISQLNLAKTPIPPPLSPSCFSYRAASSPSSDRSKDSGAGSLHPPGAGAAAAGESGSAAEAGGTARVQHAALPCSRHWLRAAASGSASAAGEGTQGGSALSKRPSSQHPRALLRPQPPTPSRACSAE